MGAGGAAFGGIVIDFFAACAAASPPSAASSSKRSNSARVKRNGASAVSPLAAIGSLLNGALLSACVACDCDFADADAPLCCGAVRFGAWGFVALVGVTIGFAARTSRASLDSAIVAVVVEGFSTTGSVVGIDVTAAIGDFVAVGCVAFSVVSAKAVTVGWGCSDGTIASGAVVGAIASGCSVSSGCAGLVTSTGKVGAGRGAGVAGMRIIVGIACGRFALGDSAVLDVVAACCSFTF
jgi:hypothetical protein